MDEERRELANNIKECREVYPTIRVMGKTEKSFLPKKVSMAERNEQKRVASEERKKRESNPHYAYE